MKVIRYKTELISPIIAYIKDAQVLCVLVNALRRDSLQEVNVVFRVKSTHVLRGGTKWSIQLQPEQMHPPTCERIIIT